MNPLIFFLALLAVAGVHLTSLPLTIWEYDESLFAMAVERYEPLRHHPPPPGYPIYIAVAQLVAPLFGHVPFRTLVGLSAFTAVAGFVLLTMAFRALTDARTGLLGALLFYLSPTMLMHATLPQSDSGALMLLALAILFCARRRPVLAALACAIAIGWRLQLSIAVVPLFLTSILLMKTWRARLAALATFTFACLAWLIPLVSVTGGANGFWTWMSGQAAYFAAHDSDLSRSGLSAAQIALRFVAHPWGTKWLAAPLLLLAIAGCVLAVRRRMHAVVPVAVMSAVYFAFALAMMDPADGVRYALPALPGVALFAAIALRGFRAAAWVLAAAYGTGAFLYVSPLLRERVATPSPPVAAITFLRAIAPANAVILYDLPLKPHAEYLLRGFTRMRVDEGLRQFGHRVGVPIYELTDSASPLPHATVFRWPTPDAYTKLTRGHYGATSIVPLLPQQRFLAVEGISSPERAGNRSWRWIGASGTLALPDLGADRVRLTFEVPEDYPLRSNRVTIDGTHTAFIVPGKPTVIDVPVEGAARIHIQAERTFVPAQANPLNRDRRTLSVMLTGVEQLPRTAVPATAQESPSARPRRMRR
jgi:hypothetical protein